MESQTSAPLTFALPKGRVLDDATAFLEACGVPASVARGDSRLLRFDAPPYRFLVVRGQDVPTYVEHGAADLGIVGRDVLLEQEPQVYEPLDLGFGYCRLAVAAPADRVPAPGRSHLRIATKYPRLAEAHFRRKGVQVEVIKLYGSIELAPLVGLSDAIVDLVSTGETLRRNGLVEVETILESTCRLIVNRASMKTRTAEISDLIRTFRRRGEAS
ncbi:ATP phosphoribosyltransferase [Deferrisoma camini]|uniref:ATP phosphoribosyltransferase n=1 Tax=Deferrisoma camini TaxID=1035120 RepID=UPI00046C9461|nr:ATP phosphoribosyltransferase [Deferrisoma camini]